MAEVFIADIMQALKAVSHSNAGSFYCFDREANVILYR